MGEVIKIKMYANSGFAGAGHVDYEEVDKAWWQSLSEEKQDEFLNDLACDHMNNHIDYGAYVIEEEE